MQLLTKTAAAFTFSAEKLFREYGCIYFWTFTFIDVPINDDYAMEEWHLLHLRLRTHFPGIKGLRVCELHRSHGIHFHVLLNRRIAIERMKLLFGGSGNLIGHNRYLDFGRVSVKKCDKSTIGYLCKYLTKAYRDSNNFGRRRRWGTIGGFKPVRVRDIIYDTPATRNRELIFGTAKCRFATFIMIQHYSHLWGALEHWPAEYRALVEKQTGPQNTDWMKHRRANEPF